MNWAILPSLLLALWTALAGTTACARSDEDQLYDLLKSGVRKTDRAFTVFHWEPRRSEFAEKFRAETPGGLLNMVRESSRSFVTMSANFGFFVATDPSASRSFGKGDWRLVQIEVPRGWKYLDVRHLRTDYLSKPGGHPGNEPACLGAILVSNNGAKLRERFAENYGRKDCRGIKERVFRRLGIRGIRYTWVVPRLPRGCNNSDRSAFIFTDGSWLSEKNVKSYTVDSRGEDPDRKAIQEIVQTQPPPTMFGGTKPAPLWADLPKQPGLSPETRAWMQERLLGCARLVVAPEPELSSGDGDEEHQSESAE
jgi:hypothetical protein